VKEFETGFYKFLETEHADLLKDLGDKKELTDEITKGLDEAAKAFRERFLA